jgi:hypothetical protein
MGRNKAVFSDKKAVPHGRIQCPELTDISGKSLWVNRQTAISEPMNKW